MNFFSALSFLTILPAPAQTDWTDGRKVLYFPLVGILIGVLLYGVDYLGFQFFTPTIRALTDVFFLAVITGGLHLDGLADSADGFFPCHSRKKALEIMRDPRVGVMGALAIVFCVSFKTAAISEFLFEDYRIWLLAVPALARTGLVIALMSADYARPEGIGSGFFQKGRYGLLTLSPVALAIPFYFGAITGLAALGLLFGITFLCLAFCRKRLGGMTGDTLGALVEILETALLILAGAI